MFYPNPTHINSGQPEPTRFFKRVVLVDLILFFSCRVDGSCQELSPLAWSHSLSS
ncbi:hypothetical protein Hanom_Chr08g00745491 [Helianthus anomalus]